jgi:hypothetical protein
MTYYILHRKMEAHPYVYHRNICIQHCVREVVHSDYPGKNTKDRYSKRTIIFMALYTLNKSALHLKNCVT